jgi:excisionase family DNA binding protein
MNRPAIVQQKHGPVRVEGVSGLLLSIPEAAAFLGISIWTVRGLIQARTLPVVKAGRGFYLRRETLARWAEGAERYHRG